jgi:hypothetical protein
VSDFLSPSINFRLVHEDVFSKNYTDIQILFILIMLHVLVCLYNFIVCVEVLLFIISVFMYKIRLLSFMS